MDSSKGVIMLDLFDETENFKLYVKSIWGHGLASRGKTLAVELDGLSSGMHGIERERTTSYGLGLL